MSDVTILGPNNEVLYTRPIAANEHAHVHIYFTVDTPAPENDLPPGTKFVDISKHQGRVNFTRLYDVGKISHAYVRASYGAKQDEMWDVNWPNARSAGLKRLPYHYWQNETDPTKQYDVFMRALGNDIGEGKWALDVEDKEPAVTLNELDEMHVWLTRVEAATGRRGRWYSGPSVFIWPNAPKWIMDYELWKSWPTSAANTCTPMLPWGIPRLWQLAWTGRVPGIEGDVDLNIAGDGLTPPTRGDWWWRGCFSHAKDESGLFPANFFVKGVTPQIVFHGSPSGPVVARRTVTWTMTVQEITADGWLRVHNDGVNDWWCKENAVRLTV